MNHARFAKTLYEWRMRNGFTQQEAADQLRISRRTLENWEQKRSMPQGFGLTAMLAIIGAGGAKPRRPTRRN